MAADPSSATPSTPAAHDQGTRPGGRLTLWGVAAAILAVGVLGGHHGVSVTTDVARGSGANAVQADPHRVGEALPRSAPTRLLIPKIAVNAPFTALTTNASGQLQPPPAANTNLVGWYSKGAAPGEAGTSIIAGHVDTATSAAVFANLDELKAGDRFSVERADGSRADFVVDSAETFEKDKFPSRRVYADAPRPEARLITCAGDYDHSVKDYTENLVVFAHLV
ncbi:class F sortase [Streptomyces sp. NK08204]|uniref:class F sortase n=1 Tax=Streptomyces sp. NK08204 TaxID=2873260 RepID=UPI001CEC4620|nr:class F sortase [Streptomyces sp. NK08204]